MTSDDLRIKAQTISGFTINNATSFIWVKSAIGFVARNYPYACKITTEDVTIPKGGGTYTPQREVVRIEEITRNDSRRPLWQEQYRYDINGSFEFFDEGTYHIKYRYVPAMPQTATEAIDMPERYLEPIKYFVASKIRGRIYGVSDSDAQNYDSLFQSYIENADIVTQRTNRRYRRLPPRI